MFVYNGTPRNKDAHFEMMFGRNREYCASE